MRAVPSDISRDEVVRIAALACLALGEDETQRFGQQLGQILAYARQLAGVPTEGVPPTTHVLAGVPVERDDEPRASLSPDEALANAPDRAPDATLFQAPRVPGG